MDVDVQQRLEALEQEVERLKAIEAIRVLRSRYHECVNEGLYTQIRELFVPDGSLDFDYLGQATGPEKLAKFFGNADGLLQFIKQFIHGHIVEVSGDTASGVSYMEARTISDGEPFIVAGRYDDTYYKTNDGWRFQHMQFRFIYSVPFNDPKVWAAEDRLRMGYKETK